METRKKNWEMEIKVGQTIELSYYKNSGGESYCKTIVQSVQYIKPKEDFRENEKGYYVLTVSSMGRIINLAQLSNSGCDDVWYLMDEEKIGSTMYLVDSSKYKLKNLLEYHSSGHLYGRSYPFYVRVQ